MSQKTTDSEWNRRRALADRMEEVTLSSRWGAVQNLYASDNNDFWRDHTREVFRLSRDNLELVDLLRVSPQSPLPPEEIDRLCLIFPPLELSPLPVAGESTGLPMQERRGDEATPGGTEGPETGLQRNEKDLPVHIDNHQD